MPPLRLYRFQNLAIALTLAYGVILALTFIWFTEKFPGNFYGKTLVFRVIFWFYGTEGYVISFDSIFILSTGKSQRFTVCL